MILYFLLFNDNICKHVFNILLYTYFCYLTYCYIHVNVFFRSYANQAFLALDVKQFLVLGTNQKILRTTHLGQDPVANSNRCVK